VGDVEKREMMLLRGVAILSFVMMLVFAGMFISAKAEQNTGIRYIYTGTDIYPGNDFVQEQYFIKFIKNDNNDISQLIFEASSYEEAGEIKRYMRGE